MKRFVIIGLGNFGSSMAEALYGQGHEVIAVDPREEAVDRISAHVTRAAVADGKSLEALQRAGAKSADAGVVSTGDDITASILATMALRDLGVKDVYVKVISRDHARVMDRLGVTETVFPERDSALSLATRLSGTAVLNYVRLGTGFSMQEMGVREDWIGRTLRQLELRQKYGISVVALHDMLTDRIITAPDPDAALKDSDTLLVAGKDEDLARAARQD
ncbi:MAG: TrkA family potassium uptake protein [Planctomycetia bacterium]|nr:TrkA family potassium uptake protein [Planctomycetia bacterium]